MTINLNVVDEYQDVLHALKTLAFSDVRSIDKDKVEAILNDLNEELTTRINGYHSDDSI